MEKNNWKTEKLQKLGTFDKGLGISKTDILAQGVPCIRYAEIYTKYDFLVKNCVSHISRQIAETSKPIIRGQLLFAGSGETVEDIGKCVAYLGNETAYASGDIIIFTFKTPNQNALFYSYYLNTVARRTLNKLGEGQSIVHIYADDLSKVLVPIVSLEEQRRIVEVLECWDKGIELVKKLIEQKELQKKYLMQQLLSGVLRLKGFTQKWGKKPLGKLITLYQGYPFKSETYSAQGHYKIITIANVKQGYLDLAKFSTIQVLPPDILNYQQLDVGDILISMTGNVGRVCLVNSKNCLLNQRVGKIEANLLNKEFLFYILQLPDFLNVMLACAQGGAQANLSTKDIYHYVLFYPSDAREQQAIAEVLSSADKEIDLLKQKLAKLEAQKKGLMQVLLTGKIRLK